MMTTMQIDGRTADGLADLVAGDPVLRRILDGTASNLHEAEEQHLDESLPDIFALIESSLDNDELLAQPLIQLLLSHGTRGWEDSLL